jgi:phenylalanyl-tRNA synthetase beta chain
MNISYDLLCQEGIAKALLIFQNKMTAPNYRVVDPPEGKQVEKMIINSEVHFIDEVYGMHIND